MQMLNALTSIRPAIRNHSVAVGQSLCGGDFRDSLKNPGDKRAVFSVNSVNGGNMRLWYHKNVNGRLRIYIAEGKNISVLVYLGRGNIAFSDCAE